jgi:hypothetical protein
LNNSPFGTDLLVFQQDFSDSALAVKQRQVVDVDPVQVLTFFVAPKRSEFVNVLERVEPVLLMQ